MIKLRWMKVPTDGRAFSPENSAPLAMLEDSLPGTRPSFYKLQYSTNGTDWADVEIGTVTRTVTRIVDGRAVRSEE